MVSNIYMICNAYEAGFGKGQELSKDGNPYDPASEIWEAWSIGYRTGRSRKLDAISDKGDKDPCPGCSAPGVCRTPACGRLKLPLDHPLRKKPE